MKCYLVRHMNTWYIARTGVMPMGEDGSIGKPNEALRVAWFNRETDGFLCFDADEPEIVRLLE